MLIKRIKRNNIIPIVLIFNIWVAGLACSSNSEHNLEIDKQKIEQTIDLKSMQFEDKELSFQINCNSDVAVLGFSINDSGKLKHCPMYASTYRGLPPVELDVFVSLSKEELWVRSSWQGYEYLAYYKSGNGQCITSYGAIELSDVPIPNILSGSSVKMPSMDANKASKVLSIKYEGVHKE